MGCVVTCCERTIELNNDVFQLTIILQNTNCHLKYHFQKLIPCRNQIVIPWPQNPHDWLQPQAPSHLIHWGRVTHMCVSNHRCLESQNAISMINTTHLLHICYCKDWLCSVFDQTVEGGADRLTWCRLICPPIITGRGVGVETCVVDNVFPPDDFWFGLDTYTNGAFCIICISMSKWWGMWCVYRCLADGGRGGRWSSAISTYWLSCTECCLCLLSMRWSMCGTMFLHLSTPIEMFLSTDYLFEKNTDWTSYLGPSLYEVYILY